MNHHEETTETASIQVWQVVGREQVGGPAVILVPKAKLYLVHPLHCLKGVSHQVRESISRKKDVICFFICGSSHKYLNMSV